MTSHENRVEYLNVVTDLTSRTQESADFLERFVDGFPMLHPSYKKQLLEAASYLRIQRHLIQKQTEHELETADMLEKIVQKIENV